jgi:hypothetical protein
MILLPSLHTFAVATRRFDVDAETHRRTVQILAVASANIFMISPI